jgi:hypothetical protein
MTHGHLLYARTQYGASDGEVERLAEAMHKTELGCVIGNYSKSKTGEFGRGCIADHKEQARILFMAMFHEHPLA